MTALIDRGHAGSTFTDADWNEANPQPIEFLPDSARPSDRPIFEPTEPASTDGGVIVIPVMSEKAAGRLAKSIAELEALLDLEPNWDSYGAHPVRSSAFVQAIRLLAAVLATPVRRPSIVPTPEGGIQLEWHEPDADLEFEIHPAGGIEVFLEMGDGETWEGPLVNSKWRLEQFLAYVTSRAQ